MNFRHRLALFLFVTLAAVQILTAVVVYTYLRHALIERDKSELANGGHALAQQLDLIARGTASDVHVLSLDYALRQAIAEHDHATEISALRNHGNRVGATAMVLVGLDGVVESGTTSTVFAGKPFAYPGLLKEAAESDQAAAMAAVGGHISWVVVVPVRAPIPIAFIAAFIPVDDALLARLLEISGHPGFLALASASGTGSWQLGARTKGAAPALVRSAARWAPGTTGIAGNEGREFLISTARLSTAGSSAPVLAVLGYPLDDALVAFRAMIWPMLLVLAIALAAALAGALTIVRGVSRPLENLAAAARRIARGDYAPPDPIAQRDELGLLSDALIAMTRSIADRERSLTAAVAAAELAREDAVRANKAKSNFLANMSHELRTPLNAIMGFGEMLEREILGALGNRRYVEYARDIGESARHLLGLVSRMLDLADTEGPGLTIARDPVPFSPLIEQSLALAAPMAERARVSLESDVGAARSLSIAGDAVRLRQALAGLLHNAIKFTPPGGSVTVLAKPARDSLIFSIRDSGIGMSEEDVAVVTRPFHRLRSALDGQHQGAGLGLPFARTIVELHGGRLEIESRPMLGTTITIQLPLLRILDAEAA